MQTFPGRRHGEPQGYSSPYDGASEVAAPVWRLQPDKPPVAQCAQRGRYRRKEQRHSNRQRHKFHPGNQRELYLTCDAAVGVWRLDSGAGSFSLCSYRVQAGRAPMYVVFAEELEEVADLKPHIASTIQKANKAARSIDAQPGAAGRHEIIRAASKPLKSRA